MAGHDHDGRPAGLPTRYQLVDVLGRGGSATAYLARDTRLGADVVVKVLDWPGPADDRFDAEVRALGRLRGLPGVVRLEAVGRSETGVPWLVEALAPGGSLADRLRRGLLGPPQIAVLVASLATTLAAAHRRGVHHGDVSPGNVVLDAEGAVLVCDFGVAALAGAPTGGPGPVTPSFAAPERRAGGPPSAAADVYAVAVVAHVAATGRLPADDDRGPRGAGPAARFGRALVRARSADPARRPSMSSLARVARSAVRWGGGAPVGSGHDESYP